MEAVARVLGYVQVVCIRRVQRPACPLLTLPSYLVGLTWLAVSVGGVSGGLWLVIAVHGVS